MAAPALAPAPALMLVYDIRCSLLEEGRLQPLVITEAPRVVPKPKTAKPIINPPWVRAIRVHTKRAGLCKHAAYIYTATSVFSRIFPCFNLTSFLLCIIVQASGNMAFLICLVFIVGVMVPRNKNKPHMFLNCLVPAVLSLGFPAMAYLFTMDVDTVDQPHAGR
jgi:hypothetical protein